MTLKKIEDGLDKLHDMDYLSNEEIIEALLYVEERLKEAPILVMTTKKAYLENLAMRVYTEAVKQAIIT